MSPKKVKSINSPNLRSPSHRNLSEGEIGEVVTKALSSLYPRVRALEDYTQQLQNVDQQVADIIKRTVSQATWTYRSTFVVYILSHILLISLIGFGLYFRILQLDDGAISIFCIASGIIVLIVISNRNPLKNVHNLMLNTMKLNIVYSGYTRQIHQVDVACQELCSHSEGIDPLKLEEMLKCFQDAINEAINAVSEAANDIE